MALALAFTSVAQATPVVWTADLAFTTPKTRLSVYNNSLTGTFTYDADTSTLSNVNLVLTYGGQANDITGALSYLDYMAQGSIPAGNLMVEATQIGFAGASSGTDIFFKFTDLISNAGGVLNLSGVTIHDIGFAKNSAKSFSGTLTGVPQATASAVPEPEAYAMMLAGLGLVGFAARRKLAK